MKNKLLYILLALISTIEIAFAQTRFEVNYESYIEGIKQNNPIAREAYNYGNYAKSQLQAVRGNYDPIVNSSTENKFFNATNYYNLAHAEIKQPIFTSQYLKVGYDYGNGSYINPEQITKPSGLPYVGFEVSLLQGFSIDKRRADVLKAQSYVDYYNAEQNIILNNLLYESSHAYFDWLYSKKLYALHSYFYFLAAQRLRGIEYLAEAGERPIIDTVEAAIFLQSRFLDQQSALIEMNKKQNELINLNWLSKTAPNTADLSFYSLDSLDQYYEKAKSSILIRTINDSINNPKTEQYKAKQQVLEVEKRYKKEMIKPKLDISYNFLSNSTTAISPAFSTNNYKWAAHFSFPLFLRNSRNEYKMASIIAKNNSLELASLQTEIKLKYSYLQQTVNIILAQLQNAEKSSAYCKMLVEAERLKYENGESSLFMLNTREGKWLEAELKLVEYKLKLVKILVNIIYLNGSLNYKLS